MGHFSVKVVCRKHGKAMKDVGVMFSYFGTFLPGGYSEGRTHSDGWVKLYVDGEGIGTLWVRGKKIGDYTVRSGTTISVATECTD